MRARCWDRGQTPEPRPGGQALRPRRPPPARPPPQRGFCYRRGYRVFPESRSHTRGSATVARGRPQDAHWRGYCPVPPSHNRDRFSRDSTAGGYRPLAGALAGRRSWAVEQAEVGRGALGFVHTAHSEACGSSRQRAWGCWGIPWAAEPAGTSTRGLAATSNKSLPTARVMRGAEVRGPRGSIPSHSFLSRSNGGMLPVFRANELSVG